MSGMIISMPPGYRLSSRISGDIALISCLTKSLRDPHQHVENKIMSRTTRSMQARIGMSISSQWPERSAYWRGDEGFSVHHLTLAWMITEADMHDACRQDGSEAEKVEDVLLQRVQNT